MALDVEGVLDSGVNGQEAKRVARVTGAFLHRGGGTLRDAPEHRTVRRRRVQSDGRPTGRLSR
jgi:hypothetical protein